MGDRRWRTGAFIALGLALVVACWLMARHWFGGPAKLEQRVKQPGEADEESGKEVDADYVLVGGVRRKRSDLAPSPRESEETNAAEEPGYGASPAVPSDANPQVISAVEAIRQRKHPERISALATPAAFDAEAFARDAESYLNTVEPGRVFQTAKPGPEVSRLRAGSPAWEEIIQGQTVTLEALAPPGAPVTFTSFDLGEFHNRLTSVTVRANEEGVAEAQFTATAGTIARVNILAGSPLASGQVRYVVYVREADNNQPRP